ncbi:MAG: hypothetical protein ACTSRA_12270 [Promethearchaeota archaeon]
MIQLYLKFIHQMLLVALYFIAIAFSLNDVNVDECHVMSLMFKNNLQGILLHPKASTFAGQFILSQDESH